MKKIAVVMNHPARGVNSHFAHFIGDFVLPFHSLLKKLGLVEALATEGVELELRDQYPMQLGPLMPLANELFPNLQIKYTSRFSQQPIRVHRTSFHSSLSVVEEFLKYATKLLPLKKSSYGVVVVERGLSRDKYGGRGKYGASGVDRRGICRGFEELVEGVKAVRPDTTSVILERLSFADQLSLFLTADTMIAQHGAALAHSHWMPIGSHIIELQHIRRRPCPRYVHQLARIKNHKVSVVYFPGPVRNGRIMLNINNPAKVTRLLQPRPKPEITP
jgi:hypothetical protein